jgi:hypothetical protein
MPGKEGSGLCPSEKELSEQRSGVFRHKTTSSVIEVTVSENCNVYLV